MANGGHLENRKIAILTLMTLILDFLPHILTLAIGCHEHMYQLWC